jgi:hypothetical protein
MSSAEPDPPYWKPDNDIQCGKSTRAENVGTGRLLTKIRTYPANGYGQVKVMLIDTTENSFIPLPNSASARYSGFPKDYP